MEESGDSRAGVGPGPAAHSAWLTPVLMVYYLCCWPQDAKSDSGSHHRASDFFSRRMGSSAVSLHLPSTSGHKKEPLCAHRSHEEIGRRKSHHEPRDDSRYHSAPSVIDEVLHRRDWERSSRELHIPLRAEGEVLSASSGSPEPPHAEPETSSLDEHRSDEQIVGRPCKKHHTNIKSSKGKKERHAEDDKDSDATEASNFYIGDNDCSTSATYSPRNECPSNSATNSPRREDVQTKSMYRAKEAKQSFNESIRSKERPRQTLVPLEEHQLRTFDFCLDDVIEQLESLDRSGATHHSIESRISLSKPPFPPPSVAAVGYEGGACYLAGRGAPPAPRSPAGLRAPPALRARHASDGDILAPALRPESGAFSESDLDLELEDEQPPPYEALPRGRPRAPPLDRKETAI